MQLRAAQTSHFLLSYHQYHMTHTVLANRIFRLNSSNLLCSTPPYFLTAWEHEFGTIGNKRPNASSWLTFVTFSVERTCLKFDFGSGIKIRFRLARTMGQSSSFGVVSYILLQGNITFYLLFWLNCILFQNNTGAVFCVFHCTVLKWGRPADIFELR